MNPQDLVAALPETYRNPSFDPYAAALNVLTTDDPSSRSQTIENLILIKETLDQALTRSIDQKHSQIGEYLSGLRDMEERLQDAGAEVTEMRRELEDCRNVLKLKRTNLHEAWFRCVYYKDAAKRLALVEELFDSIESVGTLCKERLYSKAAKLILDLLRQVEEWTEYAHLPLFRAVTSDLKKKQLELREVVTEELKGLLYLRDNSSEKLFKKYSVPGLLNLAYLTSPQEDPLYPEEISIENLLEVLESLQGNHAAASKLMDEASSDMHGLVKSCLLYATASEGRQDTEGQAPAGFPLKGNVLAVLKLVNGVVGVCAHVLK